MTELDGLGYSAHWRALFQPHGAAGLTARGSLDLPAVGDWVAALVRKRP